MEKLFGLIVTTILLFIAVKMLTNPREWVNSFAKKADKFQNEYNWIPIFGWLMGGLYKSNARFYQSTFGIWFLRFWGVSVVLISLLLFYSILSSGNR